MSAFVVSKAHIDYMVRAATVLRYNHCPLTWIWGIERETGNYERATLPRGDDSRELEVGQMLWDENVASVSFRYPDDDGAGDVYSMAPPMMGLDPEPVQVLKAIQCYEYQSCEHGGWEASEAKAFCDSLRSRTISGLPGYDDAAWGIAETRTHSVERIGR